MKIKIIVIAAAISAFLIPIGAKADAVYLKNGREQKGIVIEAYHDRILINTVDGELTIKMKDIKDILYDMPEQNLVKLGDFHEQRGNLVRAYTYYRKAYKLNPEYKPAQDKFIHIRSVLLQRPERQLMGEITRKQALFKEAGAFYRPAVKEGIPETAEERLIATTGLSLVSENGMPKVESIKRASSAEKAGMLKGDLIYAVWGKIARYMDLASVCGLIVNSPSPEVAIAIRRKIAITLDPEKERIYGGAGGIGLNLAMKEAGVTALRVREGSPAAAHGLKKQDIIRAINGQSIRYTPFKKATALINKSCAKGRLELDVIRDTTLWRKEL